MRGRSGWLAIVLCAGAACAFEADTNRMETIITSDRLDYHYGRAVAVFEDNVVVVDPELKLESEKLTVLFDGRNEVKSMTATGNVRMWHADKAATCEKAIYIASKEEVILAGDAVIRQGKDSVSGRMITFRLNEDVMTCVPGRLVVFPGGRKVGGESPAAGGDARASGAEAEGHAD